MLFNLIISDRAVLSTSLEINVMTTHTDEQSIISRGRAAPARGGFLFPMPRVTLRVWSRRRLCTDGKREWSMQLVRILALSRNPRVLLERPLPLAWTLCSRARYYIVSSIHGANHKSRGTILGANGASKNCADVRATGCATHEKSLLRTHQRSPGITRENGDSNCANYVPLCDRHGLLIFS